MQKYYVPGLESVSFQSDSFFKALCECIGNLRTKGDYKPKAINESGLVATVMAYTGMLIDFKIDPSESVNAWVMLPQLDKNHPFWDAFRREYGNSEGVALIKAAGGTVRGTVDRETGRVSGVYSKVEATVALNRGLINNKTRYTTEEVVSILLHELGHLFTYFEVFGKISRTSNIIAAMAKGLYELEDQTARTDVIKEASKALCIDIEDPGSIAQLPKGKRETSAETIFISKLAMSARSESGISSYETRSCEQLADQYAMKFGAGRHLATANFKMYSDDGDASYRSRSLHILLEVIDAVHVTAIGAGWALMFGASTVAAVAGTAAATFGFVTVLALLIYDPLDRTYDNGEQRIVLMRRTLTEALKNPKLSDEQRKAYLADIEVIKSLDTQLQFKRGLFEYLVTTITPRGRKDLRQQDIQKSIEALLTNDLFVKASQFKVGV